MSVRCLSKTDRRRSKRIQQKSGQEVQYEGKYFEGWDIKEEQSDPCSAKCLQNKILTSSHLSKSKERVCTPRKSLGAQKLSAFDPPVDSSAVVKGLSDDTS